MSAEAVAGTTAEPAKRPLLSPLNQRRWQNFKANRRGYWSLWIFLVLFVLSLFSEFIANDRPVLACRSTEYSTIRNRAIFDLSQSPRPRMGA